MKANQSPHLDSCDNSYHKQSIRSQDKQSDTIRRLDTSANDDGPFAVRQNNVANDNVANDSAASNDASYSSDVSHESAAAIETKGSDASCGYKKAANKYVKEDCSSSHCSDTSILSENTCLDKDLLIGDEAHSEQLDKSRLKYNINNKIADNSYTCHDSNKSITTIHNDVSERIFMTSLVKHTGIALAIIIPLAAFSAYAATPVQTGSATPSNQVSTTILDVSPDAIIYKSASEPTTVDSVDLDKYAGTWYEIGRLPMYFQRNCASDVTANYTEKTDGSGITVTNKCLEDDGSQMVAEGLAKPADTTGSKLKVTFLPSWIRWLPVGRADYWVLARDADYQTALVGTPNTDNLWLLARSPNVSQETYTKYRQIAEEQGYDLKEFTLTPHSGQTVSLTP